MSNPLTCLSLCSLLHTQAANYLNIKSLLDLTCQVGSSHRRQPQSQGQPQ